MKHPPLLVILLLLFAASCRPDAPKQQVAGEVQQLAERAALGDRDAQHDLAVEYFRGERVPRDYAKAAAFWRLAVAQGDVRSMNNLGYLLFGGMGVDADPEQAVALWHRAAEEGVAESHTHLGYAAQHGQGTAHDSVEAYARYHAAVLLASQSEDPVDRAVLDDARSMEDALKPRLTEDQRTQAEQRARSYVGAQVSP